VDEFVEKMLNISLSDTENNHKPEDWKVETNVINHPTRGEVIEEIFTSPSFKLMTGNAHFTLNPTYRVPLPKGDMMIFNQIWDIVSGDKEESVPLSDLYNHHWLIGGNEPLDLCEDDYFFGGGAEYRTMDYTFLEGYVNQGSLLKVIVAAISTSSTRRIFFSNGMVSTIPKAVKLQQPRIVQNAVGSQIEQMVSALSGAMVRLFAVSQNPDARSTTPATKKRKNTR